MINFRQREYQVSSVLILLSIAVLVGSLAFMLLVPAPSVAGIAKGREMSRKKLLTEIAQTTEQTQEREKATLPRLWQGNAEVVTARVLAQLTEQANRRALKLIAFRPQKPQMPGGTTELPFTANLTGPFPAVRGMLATLDAPGSKIALRSVQLAAIDEKSNTVTATLNLSAYLPASAAPSPVSGTKTGGPRG